MGFFSSLGSLFGPVGTAVGGAIDYSKARSDEKRARSYNEQMSNTRLQRLVKDAKKAGIHPLYALGAGTHTPTYNVGDGKSNAEANLSRNISDAIGYAEKRKIQGIQNNNVNADTALKQAEASKIALETQHMQNGRPLFIPVYDQVSGKTIRMIDPELAEGMDNTAAIMTSIYGNTQPQKRTGRPATPAGRRRKSRKRRSGFDPKAELPDLEFKKSGRRGRNRRRK
jgi:hypothetical protein